MRTAGHDERHDHRLALELRRRYRPWCEVNLKVRGDAGNFRWRRRGFGNGYPAQRYSQYRPDHDLLEAVFLAAGAAFLVVVGAPPGSFNSSSILSRTFLS